MSGVGLPDFLAQLALMARAGLPLPEGLRQMASTAQAWRYRRTCRELAAETAAGEPLSAAMRRRPHLFPPQLTQLVATGEQTGTLPEMLGEAADFARKQHDLALQTRERLAYPCFGFCFAIVILLAMLTLVMPRLVYVLSDYSLGGEVGLSLATRAVMGLCQVLGRIEMAVLLGLPLLVIACLWLLLGRGLALRVWLRLLRLAPVVGPELVLSCDYTRLCAMLTLYTRHGLSLVEGLRQAAAVLDVRSLQVSVARWANELAAGKTLLEMVQADPQADPMFLGSLAYLPEAELGAGLARLTEAFRARADRARATLATWWTVGAMALMIGTCVLVILVTFLPLLNAIGIFGGDL